MTTTQSKKNRTALSGLKILDLSRILAGPYATQILGDLGAQVIKVEPPTGDDTRKWGPPFINDQSTQQSTAAYFYCANRNKKILTLDLKTDKDQKKLHALLKQSDVLVENFTPAISKKLNLEYEGLKQLYPKLIHCQIQSFGDGPYSNLKGYDAMIQAMGGLMSITGSSANAPAKTGVAITDITTGLYALIGILAALYKRKETSLGQKIEVSLFDTQVATLINSAMNFLVSGNSPKPMGTAHPNIVPYQAFNCEDHLIFIAVGNNLQFINLSKTLQQDWHLSPDYQTNPSRVKNRKILVNLIEGVLLTKKRAHWLELLEKNDIPCSPVNDLESLSKDPHLIARNLFMKMDNSNIPCLRSPLNFSKTPITDYVAPEEITFSDFQSSFKK